MFSRIHQCVETLLILTAELHDVLLSRQLVSRSRIISAVAESSIQRLTGKLTAGGTGALQPVEPCTKWLLDQVIKAQWSSIARRLSARGPPNRSHRHQGGTSKKNMSESQIAPHGRTISAIRPVQRTTKIRLVRYRNTTFSVRSLQGTAAQSSHQRAP